MRESTKALDQITMAFGMIYKRLHERFPIRRHLVDHRFIEVDGPVLIDWAFAMGERMTKKDPPRNGQLFVKFSVECSHSNSACQIVLPCRFS